MLEKDIELATHTIRLELTYVLCLPTYVNLSGYSISSCKSGVACKLVSIMHAAGPLLKDGGINPYSAG